MLWEVVEDDNVAEIIDDACETYGRLRDAWNGLLWLLAHDPTIGRDLGLGGTQRIHKQADYLMNDVPEITVLYEYSNTKIEIRAVRLRHYDA
jgi:hypothetical protein